MSQFYQLDELVISNSSLNLLRSCARKLEFRKFFEYSKREESVAMNVGSALHAGYQHFLVHGDKQAAIFELFKSYPFKYAEKRRAARSLNGCVATLEEMMRFKEYGNFELAYFDVLNKETGEIESRPAIEVPFKIKIANFSLSEERDIPVYYIGYIDVVFYDRLRDSFKPMDIKTTTRTADDKSVFYQFDDQCLPYALVLKQATGREFKQLDVSYMVTNLDLVEPEVQDYSFIKTEEDIADWSKGLAIDLQLLKLYYDTGWFPRSGGSCYAWNRACQYFKYCQSRNHVTINKFLAMDTNEYKARDMQPWIETELALVA